MATSRDDFVIAFRSAFLKKKDKQKFSLLSLIFLSIFIIILGSFNFKVIKVVKTVIKEIIYRSSYISSVPENKIKEIISEIKSHINLHKGHQKELIKIENTEQIIVLNNFLTAENKKLRELIDESINSDEILSKVLIDKDSPFLKTIILNKGTRENIKIGMVILDGVYLVGKVIEVNYTNSRALLLNDLNSKIPVILEPLGKQAVVSGTGKNHGVIEYTKEDYTEKVNNNEIIVYTSGLGGMFKPGIPVGKISFENIDLINFFSDFKQLDYVKIVDYKIGSDN